MADLQGYFILFLIISISTFLIRALYKSKSGIPPSPFALPIIGHLHLLGPSPHQAFHKLSIQYGPVFRLFLGSKPCVVFNSPQTAKELFRTYDNLFLDRPHNSAAEYIAYEGRGFIFSPYGSYWKFLKRIVVSELLNSKTLDSLIPVRRDEITRFLTSLSHKAKNGKSVELEGELMKMTNNVISRMLMSKRFSDEEDEAREIKKIITDIAELMFTFNLSDHIWFLHNLDIQGIGKRAKEIRGRFDVLIEKIIEKHEEARKEKKEKEEVKDLLDLLLDISEDESMEIKITRDNIKAFILDIFGAGTDTTAITIEWALSELINNPKIMKKAVEEIDQIVGKERLLQESDIPNLPYLQAIIKETLRLHPAAPVIQRISKEDCTVGSYHIPAKTIIFYNIWGVGRDPAHWENPLEFRPERFEEKQLEVRGQHFELLPFGSGRRMCPGTSLGLMVVYVTLGCMIQCFDWKAGKYGDLSSVDMEEGTISIFLMKTLFKSNGAKSKSCLPPSPFGLPIIGHLHLIGPNLHQSFHKLSIKYGPVYRLFLGSKPYVVIGSPETAKAVFQTYENVFLDRPHHSFADYIAYGGRGFVFAPYGSYWKFLKKIIVSKLLNAKTLDSLLPVRQDEINHFLKCLSQRANVGKSVELEGELMKMTNNIVSRMIMSNKCSEEDDEPEVMRKIVTDINELLITFNLSDFIWFLKNIDLQGIEKRSKKILGRFDAFIENIMRKHEEARKGKKEMGEVKDLLDLLLDISEDESMEIKMTRDNIKAFILDIIVAGTDTSAITTEWAMAELINNPKIMKKAVEEIDRVVGKERLLRESDIPNLPYLQSIVKESLRLHPAAPLIHRLSTEDCSVGGYHIPVNTPIFFNVWSVGRDPSHWENPLEFRPKRFEEKQFDLRGQHFELLPFGSGRRMCPGILLGLMLIHVTLGCMIQCFDWKAGEDGDLSSVDMEEGIGLMISRANPLVCVLVTRLDPISLSM
ncbi:hypothetical protein LXL04_036310 [Taraxacum kok-saghyz]